MADNEPSDVAKQVLFERRLLAGTTVSSVFAFLFWIVAISTDNWFWVVPPQPVYNNRTDSYFLHKNAGLWRFCREMYRNRTVEAVMTTCQYHKLFPSHEEVAINPQIDHTILHYTRTFAVFSLLTSLIMLMGHGFSLYTFSEARYTYKRVAGCVHLLTAALVIIVIEVLMNSISYERTWLPARHPPNSDTYYGFSYFLAWLVFLTYLVCGAIFLYCSRKRKRGKHEMDQVLADEPTIIRRI